MLLYDAFGPNPRAMRMFLLEKGITLPTKELDLVKGDSRQKSFAEKNPGGQLPVLELDDGRYLAETAAIFEYLEEKHPKPALVGTTAEERAETRMWQRRVELNVTENLYAGFRSAEGAEMFKSRMHIIPAAAADLKQAAQERLAWLDGLIAGRDFIVPNRFTIADIILYCALDFGASVGQPITPSLSNMNGWFKRVSERPSAKQSRHPATEKAKING
ncbi:MAG: glutathione S-transferase family protein [Candidatus Binataceae bacterium]